MKFLTWNVPKKFLEVGFTCSMYLQGRLGQGLQTHQISWPYDAYKQNGAKKNEKLRPEAPFEYYFSIDDNFWVPLYTR